MMKWYEDQHYLEVAKKCDDEIKAGDISQLKKCIDTCIQLATDDDLHIMIRAGYYYDAFNCMSAISKKDGGGIQEKQGERLLLFIRKSAKLINQYREEASADEWSHGTELFRSVLTNYANLLDTLGRTVSAIDTYRIISSENFCMARGNLGITLVRYGMDNVNENAGLYLIEKGKELIQSALIDSDASLTNEARKAFNQWLEYLRKKNFPHFEIPTTRVIVDDTETEYRRWILNDGLCLNILNDVEFTNLEVATDPIYFARLIQNIDEVNQDMFAIFNEIKQEFVSARFQIFEATERKTVHFSDINVYLVSLYNYSDYNLSIEQLKMAYRSAYSIFDRIGYFLEKYFALNMEERNISFKKIWKKLKEYDSDILSENRFLNGLFWIHKDINAVVKVHELEEYVDPMMKDITNTRNIMEHRLLEVARFETLDNEKNIAAKIMDFETLRQQTIFLLKKSREAIILLKMAVDFEENKKGLGVKLGNIYAHSYFDDWKSHE